MALIKINGINLNVAVQGSGHPLLLIHGVGGDHTQLQKITNRFSANFKILAPDCRGHGESDKPDQYTLNDHVQDIIGLMDHFNIPSTFLLGVSMGSYIAQAVAIAVPDRIERLVLTVPKSNGLTSSVQRLMKENEKDLKGLNFHEVVLFLLKYMVYDPEVMKAHVDIFDTKLNLKQFVAANKALDAFDFRPDLPKIKAKTLVISGRYDALNPPAEGKECAELIPGADFIEMQYSGHSPLYEEEELYLKIVEDFLKQP